MKNTVTELIKLTQTQQKYREKWPSLQSTERTQQLLTRYRVKEKTMKRGTYTQSLHQQPPSPSMS